MRRRERWDRKARQRAEKRQLDRRGENRRGGNRCAVPGSKKRSDAEVGRPSVRVQPFV